MAKLTEKQSAVVAKAANIILTQGYNAFLQFMARNLEAADQKRKVKVCNMGCGDCEADRYR